MALPTEVIAALWGAAAGALSSAGIELWKYEFHRRRRAKAIKIALYYEIVGHSIIEVDPSNGDPNFIIVGFSRASYDAYLDEIPDLLPEKLVGEIATYLLPARVYSAPCAATEDEIKGNFIHPKGSGLMFPFIVRAEQLFTFSSPSDRSSPFRQFVRPNGGGSERAREWWDDPDRFLWYVQLLNRTLNKLTGRRGLNLDKEHKRYYFEQAQDGEPSSVTYRSLTGKRTSRQVVWRPAFRHSGELKNYWEHLAVGLRFHRVTATAWCISVRPERRFTRDGRTLLTPKGTGRRATSRKSHMYNINVLAEVNFWREFLADRGPRIIMKFGAQSLVVDAEMMSVTVSWPGVPDDARPVTYTRAEDDLFTTAEYDDLMRSGLEDDDGEEEEESGAD